VVIFGGGGAGVSAGACQWKMMRANEGAACVRACAHVRF
jgi:hypothetical protein